MRKTFISFFALLLVAQFCWAVPVTPPDGIPAYWASADNQSGAALWSAISARTNLGYSSIGYKGLYSAYRKTDVYPADSVGKAGKIWDMYGECVFAPSNTCGNYSGVCDCYNREHSIPQSWWGGGTSGIGNDIFHVLPTDGKVNGVRSNYEYGEVNGGTNWVGNKFGPAGSWSTDKKTIASAAGESVQGSGSVFEPKPQYKGDIARGLLGTIIKWQQSNLTSGNNFFTGTYTATQNFGLTKRAVVLLMKWHREDPVSQKEIDRNNGIQETQGNRNPFIDYPYLAEYIWGEHAGETVNMSMLMPSTDPNFIPGVSDGWRGGDVPPTPPTPVTKYGVTWSVNGEASLVDSIPQGSNIISLPPLPVSCSQESNVFMGWTNTSISGTTDEAPIVLYTKIADFPAVTEDVTYYAVFAHADTVEYGPQLGDIPFTFETNKTAYENDGVSIVFAQAKGNNAPKYMDPAMRAYGGNTITVAAEGMTQVLFRFAANDGSNTITPNEGEFVNDTTWIGYVEEVVFTIGGSSGHRKIASMTVSRNATGEGEIYSRYITSCQDPTEFMQTVVADAPVRKVLIGGQIYIVRKGAVYTLTGSRVK